MQYSSKQTNQTQNLNFFSFFLIKKALKVKTHDIKYIDCLLLEVLQAGEEKKTQV